MKRETLEGWFINILPDLNQNDDETSRYIIQNTLWWIGVTGIDAIRQDTWQYVPNSFWRKWTAAIKREYPKVNVVGEVLDGDVAHCSFYQGGRMRFDGVDTGLDTLFDFPLLRRPVVLLGCACAARPRRGTRAETYFDLDEQAPGPVVWMGDELREQLSDLSAVDSSHRAARERWVATFAAYDTGSASSAVADWVTDRLGA